MSEHECTIKELERKRLAFENNQYKIPSLRDHKRWIKLLESDDASIHCLSAGRQSIHRRSKHHCITILESVGSEVLLLVLSSFNQEKLAMLNPVTFVAALQTWWNGVSHPQSLTVIASKYSVSHGLGTVISAAQQSWAHAVPSKEDASAAFGIMITPFTSAVLRSPRSCHIPCRAKHPKAG
tara:strand:- start:1257 stop:1799 length:543 start_codon:yes stop_codon:yes gene_type:complete